MKCEEFEKTFSALIYGETEVNIRRIIGRIAVLTFNASMYYFTAWYSDNLVSHKNTKLELIEPEIPHSDFLKRTLEVEKDVKELMQKHPEKKELYESFVGACAMIEASNILAAALYEERRMTEEEASIVEKRMEEYHKIWLRDNKEGEFYENRAFIDGITNYVNKF